MLDRSFYIEDRKIGEDQPPYIIAEMSANHAKSIDTAIQTIHAAKSAGADAVKIQTYTADTLTIDCKMPEYKATGAWEGQYLYDLYSSASMPWEWLPTLLSEAKKIGITLFSTPFDASSVDFLEAHDIPAYKVASPEIIDLPLIRRIAKTGKPVILSTGSATIAEINSAVEVLLEEDAHQIAILKCTSEYPAPYKKINLKTIPHLMDLFKCPIGLSDHTMGFAVPIASVALGASIIEKHFILDRKIKTADSFFSATPDELKQIVEGTKAAYDSIGEVSYPILQNSPQRSLIATRDIYKGDQLIEGVNYKSLRPGGGIEPKFMPLVEKKQAVVNIRRGTFIKWEMLS